MPSKYNFIEKKFFKYAFSDSLKSEMIKISKKNNVYFYDMEDDTAKYYEQNIIYYCDDIHPNDKGAKIISKLMYIYLNKNFNIKTKK